jgi:hypothetical protein
MVFNATFNNISVISWRSVLLVEEIRVPRENHRPAASHWLTIFKIKHHSANDQLDVSTHSWLLNSIAVNGKSREHSNVNEH